jgi:uncharacterized protein (TIGR02246 family)
MARARMGAEIFCQKGNSMSLTFRMRALAAVLWLVLATPVVRAQDESKPADAESAAIKQVFTDFYEAFSRQDAHATAMTFAPDGDFTNMFGIHVHGREAIERRFSALFAGNLKGARRTDTVRNISFYAPTVAFVDADTVITGTKEADGSMGRVRRGLMIVVLTKEQGSWYISNFHEAEYPDRAVPAISSTK